MKRWYQIINKRFKKKDSEAQKALNHCLYSLQDIRDERTSRAYMQNIIRHVKATGLSLYN